MQMCVGHVCVHVMKKSCQVVMKRLTMYDSQELHAGNKRLIRAAGLELSGCSLDA